MRTVEFGGPPVDRESPVTAAEMEASLRRASGVDVKRTTDHGMSRSIYLHDPEGTFLELYCDALTDWKAFYKESEGELISGAWDPLAQPASTEKRYVSANFDPEAVEDAPIQPRWFTRVTLITEDFDAMLTFYQDIIGLSTLHLDRAAGGAVLAATTGAPSIALFAAKDGEKPGLHHLGFELVSEVELQRLRDDAQTIDAAPVEIVNSASKSGVVLRSPDGLLLEFFLPKNGGDWSAQDALSARDLYLI